MNCVGEHSPDAGAFRTREAAGHGAVMEYQSQAIGAHRNPNPAVGLRHKGSIVGRGVDLQRDPYRQLTATGKLSTDYFADITYLKVSVSYLLGPDLEVAKRMQVKIGEKLCAGESPEDVQFWAGEKIGRPVAQFGEILDFEVDLNAVGVSQRVYDSYIGHGLKVIKAVAEDEDRPRWNIKKPEPSRRKRPIRAADYPIAAKFSLHRITAAMVHKYFRIVVRGLNKAEAQAALATAQDDVRLMRCLFVGRLRAMFAERLHVPQMPSFFAATEPKQKPRNTNPPNHKFVALAHAQVAALAAVNLFWFLIAVLALFAGLTHDEIVACHSSWLGYKDGPILRAPGPFGHREIPIPLWLFVLLKALGEGYFVGATESYRERLCHQTAAWLAEHGVVGEGRPLLALRHLFGRYLAASVGEGVMGYILGYASTRPTENLRTGEEMTATEKDRWENPPNFPQ